MSERKARRARKLRAVQQLFDFPLGRGGKRKGAGRKPKGEQAGVRHAVRPDFDARHPVFLTLELAEGLPSLRDKETLQLLIKSFNAAGRKGLVRVVHFSIQVNHMHLIVESDGRDALTRGMRGLVIRMAKALNRRWERSGVVFPDRYHARILKSPREVRGALRYVLDNAKHHGLWIDGVDSYSTGPYFDGWEEDACLGRLPIWIVARARTWLLACGWRRAGPIFKSPMRARAA